MIQSMTGYGSTTFGKGNNKYVLSIKTVNGRFLDLKFKGHELDPSLEKDIKDLISSKLIRGTIYVNIEQYQNNNIETLYFNKERFDSVLSILNDIEKKYQKKINIENIININDLFRSQENLSIDSKTLLRSFSSVCNKVIKMRKLEGLALKTDIDARIKKLSATLNVIKKQLPAEHKKRNHKLKNRLTELLDSSNIDEIRLNQEIALLAEKSDVTEEVVRLESHFDQFQKILKESKPIGKRLTFLLQEIGRELNTLGSKSFSEIIVNKVIIMKDESEKIREQVQNIL